MALEPIKPHPAATSSPAASAIAAPRHARSLAAATPQADADADAGGFAAQLLRAQPRPDADAKAAGTDVKSADATKSKPAAEKDDDADADTPAASPGSGAQDARDTPDAITAAGPTPAVDPSALMPWMQQMPPTTVSLAGKAGAAADDGAADALGALRKAGAKGGKDALLAGLAAGKGAVAATATTAGTALTGAGGKAATDPTAALAQAAGAANAATDTRDSLAALLPQPDPVTVQAGAVGAAPGAVQDPNPGLSQAQQLAPAQASLPMAPQSAAFGPALGQQIELWMRDGVQHAEVQLNPQDLGPIRVRIAMEGAQARVEMSADVQSTRDALQQALPQLTESLGQVGVSVTGGGVSDQSTAQSQAQFQQAQANAGGLSGPGRAGSGRGAAGGVDLGEHFATANAARQAAQRRGLLDMYA